MDVHDEAGWIQYTSRRIGDADPPELTVRYRPLGRAVEPLPGTLE
jgi:hypothetical protein